MTQRFTQKELLAILRRTKHSKLWNGKGCEYPKEMFVCLAIANAVKDMHGSWDTPDQLQTLVRRHIGNGTMESFLKDQFGVSEESLGENQPNVQKWRRLMLNSMIKMVEAGDYE